MYLTNICTHSAKIGENLIPPGAGQTGAGGCHGLGTAVSRMGKGSVGLLWVGFCIVVKEMFLAPDPYSLRQENWLLVTQG